MSLVLVFVSLMRHLNMPSPIVTVKKMEIMKNWSETGKLILDSTQFKNKCSKPNRKKKQAENLKNCNNDASCTFLNSRPTRKLGQSTYSVELYITFWLSCTLCFCSVKEKLA